MIRLLLTVSDGSARQALRIGLGAAVGLEVVGEIGSGAELLEAVAAVSPSVVLLDLSMPGPDLFAVLPTLREQHPQLRILARGEITNEHYVARVFDQGAHGYVLKSSLLSELLHGLGTVAAGRRFLCSAIGLALLNRFYTSDKVVLDGAAVRLAMGLSKREMEVLSLVAEGLTNGEIAMRLFTSKRTIETHRQNIMEKTRTRNTASLIKLAAQQGLLSE